MAVAQPSNSAGRRLSLPPRGALSLGAEHLAMATVLVFWTVPAAGAFGGRGVHTELVFAIFMVAALFLLRAWQVPWRSAALAAVVALAALLVCAFAPSGWSGADTAAGYALAAAAYLAARRYVRDSNRRTILVTAICLADVYQFSKAFTPWWGGGNPADEMTGTFYGHNAYAAFLLPGAILGLGLIAGFRRPWSIAGWVSVPLCVAGIVYSSSRATFAALVVGLVLMFGCALRNRRAAFRVASALVLATIVTFALPGPPLFSDRVSPFASTADRAATGESLEQNGHYRTEFWRGAGEVLLHRPLVGGGYHSLASASALYTPSGWARSPNAHNGYLQALSDGGLLLGLPFLIAIAVSVLWALRRLWVVIARRSRGQPVDFVVVGAAVALLGALAHSTVDADWTYPAIMIEAALLIACIAPHSGATGPVTDAPRRRSLVLAPLSVGAVVAVLIVQLFALHQWQIDGSPVAPSPAAFMARAEAAFGDYRPADRLLRKVVDGEVSISAAQAAQLLALTKDQAKIDVHLELRRDAVGARYGLLPDAVERAQGTLRQIDGAIAPYVADLVTVQAFAGDLSAVRATLARDFAAQARTGLADPSAANELALWARYLGTGGDYACQVAAVSGLDLAPPVDAYPAPTSRCRAS